MTLQTGPSSRRYKKGDRLSAREVNEARDLVRKLARSVSADGFVDSTGVHTRRRISPKSVIDKDLIGWWHFTGHNGDSSILDLSGNGHTAVLGGTASPNGISYDIYYSLKNKTNSYIDYPCVGLLMPPEISISIWLRASMSDSHCYLWGALGNPISGGGGHRWGVQIIKPDSNPFNFWFLTSVAIPDWDIRSTTGTPGIVGAWINVICTYGRGYKRIIVDGVLNYEISISSAPLYYYGVSQIRSGPRLVDQPDYDFAGNLDDIRVWNRPLELWEAQKIYVEGRKKYAHFNYPVADALRVMTNLSVGGNLEPTGTGGMKIGTTTAKKIAFYGTIPVNQPNTVVDAATQDLTGGDTVDKTKLEADLISNKDAINTIIDRLQELGLIG